jgi:hypothetical protein
MSFAKLEIPEASSQPQTGSSSGSGDSGNALYAAERARLLFGSYRKGDANDPDTYVAAVAAVLAGYPEDVVAFVTDPRTGVQRKFPKWMPNSGEVAEFCEEHDRARKYAEKWDAGAQQIEAERLAIPDYRPKGPSIREYTYGEFMAMTNGQGRPVGRFETGTKFQKYAKPVESK